MTIISVETGTEGDLRRVGLSDGSFFSLRTCYLPSALADACEGFELGPGDEEALCFASACLGAEKTALRLVARAEQATFGLGRKLERRGHDSASAGAAVSRLCELGLVDDGRYARLWLESRLCRASSPARLLASLRAKGIGREDAQSALSDALDEEAELRLLGMFARKRLRGGGAGDGGRALKYALKSEGFSSSAIEIFFDEQERA